MARGNGCFWKIWAVVSTLILGYLLLTLIQASDRQRESNVRLIEALRSRKNERFPGAGNPEKTSAVSAAFPAANAPFFVPDAPEGGEIVSAISADVPGFNPLTVNEANARMVLSLCQASLAERNWEHPETFEPMLAESWEVSPDHRSYRVKLRRGALWQAYTDPESGEKVPPCEITVDDFLFTVEAIKNQEVDCASMRVYYQDLQSVEKISDYEMVFHWDKAFYGSLAATLELSPLSRRFYAPGGRFDAKRFNDDHQKNRMIVGCGPYQLVSWEKDHRIVLTRNPSYFGKALGISPALTRREIQIIKLPNTQFQALLGQKIQMLSLTPEQWAKRCAIPAFQQGNIRRFRWPSRAYSYIGYNEALPCFSDRKTRQALTLLVDREKILRELLYGFGKIANGPFSPASAFADPALKPWPCDPERAKALLREAGWKDENGDGILERDGKPFVFTMMQISGSSLQNKMLPLIKESFASAGIDMQLQTVEWSVYIDRLNQRNFEACNLGWTGSIDPDLYQIFHSSQIGAGDNFIGYRNPELDSLIVELRGEFDPAKRLELCRKIEKILYEDQPYTFLFFGEMLVALRDQYENVRLFPEGLEPLSFWSKTAL